jgi:CDP-glycerol glycerophosphotransferase (TagB/SpsB family)
MPGARIGFLCCHPYQRAILEPTYTRMAQTHACMLTSDMEQLVEFAPRVIVQSEGSGTICALRERLPNTLIVHTRHGLACKRVAHEAARQSDFTCQTSAWLAGWFARRGTRPRRRFWITGYPALDPLFRGAVSAGRSEAHPRHILYAPTYNEHLSSIPMLGSRAVELLSGADTDVHVTVKPHPHTARTFGGWLRRMEQEASRNPRVHLADPQEDIVAHLLAADVLVTDVSSVALAYLALDRPIVLLTNRDCSKDPSHFEPEALEWQWRDMGDELRDVAALPRTLARALDEPHRHATARAAYRNLLFGELTDGRSSERLCLELERACHESTLASGVWF